MKSITTIITLLLIAVTCGCGLTVHPNVDGTAIQLGTPVGAAEIPTAEIATALTWLFGSTSGLAFVTAVGVWAWRRRVAQAKVDTGA